jgi:hypothetical protein
MPTAQPAFPTSAKTGVNPPRPRSGARATGSSAGRSGNRASRAKGARTRGRSTANSTLEATGTAARRESARTGGAFGGYAERAVLIPVGAALIARERMVASVNDTISSYSSSAKARAQLRRFERRGSTARNRLEREVRKTRVRFERELRQRRREIERTVSNLEDRRGAVTKNGADLANRVPELATQVQERILGLV